MSIRHVASRITEDVSKIHVQNQRHYVCALHVFDTFRTTNTESGFNVSTLTLYRLSPLLHSEKEKQKKQKNGVNDTHSDGSDPHYSLTS